MIQPLIYFAILLCFPLLFRLSDSAILYSKDSTVFTRSVVIEHDLIVHDLLPLPEGLPSTEDPVAKCNGAIRVTDVIANDPNLDGMDTKSLRIDDQIYWYTETHIFWFNIDVLEMKDIADHSDQRFAFFFSPPGQPTKLYLAAGVTTVSGNDAYTTDCRRFDVVTHQWDNLQPTPFTTNLGKETCATKTCFVHGGTNEQSNTEFNHFYEYLHEEDDWVDHTTSESPAAVGHAFHYMPHMNALVIAGGSISRKSAVDIFNLWTKQWTHYAIPQHLNGHTSASVDDNQEMQYATSVVYGEAIFIIPNWMGPDVPLVKLAFDAETRTPTYYHYPVVDNAISPWQTGHAAVLVGSYMLYWSGEYSNLGASYHKMSMISLC